MVWHLHQLDKFSGTRGGEDVDVAFLGCNVRVKDGDSMFLRNVCTCLQVHTALRPKEPISATYLHLFRVVDNMIQIYQHAILPPPPPSDTRQFVLRINRTVS
jgi:hypothetical protein